MKRTCTAIVRNDANENGYDLIGTITAEVTGEMSDRTKVWTNLEDDNDQYYCIKLDGKGNGFLFIHL